MTSLGTDLGALELNADVSAVELASGVLSVAEAGRGGRPLLLVHGFTGTKEDFGDFLDAFAADGWWVVAPDLRGHGASHKPPAETDYSIAVFAAEMSALVDHLGWDSYVLLGHSMGGMIAQEMALSTDPDRIERLVLMDTHHAAPDGLDPDTVAKGMDYLRANGFPALLELLEQVSKGRKPAEERVRAERPGYSEWAAAKTANASPAMYAAMATEMVNRPSTLSDLASLSVPTRVVVGDQDADFIDACRAMAATIPGADLVVIPDAAHSPQFENPQAWWTAVSQFVAASV